MALFILLWEHDKKNGNEGNGSKGIVSSVANPQDCPHVRVRCIGNIVSSVRLRSIRPSYPYRKKYEKKGENEMEIPDGTINKLDEALSDIVDSGGGTWQERKEEVLKGLSEDGKRALEEFTAWFDEGDF